MMASINSIDGRIQYARKKKERYNRKDFTGFIAHLRKLYPDTKLCLFIDNAKIHTGYDVEFALTFYDMEVVYNVPYYP